MVRLKGILLCLVEFLLIFDGSFSAKPEYSPDLETALRQELFAQYEVLQRPTEIVGVQVGLTVLTVNDMNIKDQVLSVSGYLTLRWRDSRLDWSNTSTTSQDFTNVKFLFSTEEYVWRPALVIENSVTEFSIISDKTNPMRIMSGNIIWNPAGIYEVSCESDTTYYPLDTQQCSIKVTSWAYTATEVTLTIDDDPVDLSFYSSNGEWDMISTAGEKSNDKSRGGTTFSALTYTLKLRRRPMFHVLNTLFPVALMAVLIAMVFKLPVDSGEKIGFSLTVLLAYAVYLTMISDNIPSTSVTVCFLSIYLAFILTLGALSVILTIIVLVLHHKTEDEPIPNWLQTFATKYLSKIACLGKCGCLNKKKVEDVQLFEHTNTFPEKDKDELAPDDNKENGLTWQILSKMLDRVFFNIYVVFIALGTTILFMVIVVNY